MGVGQLRHTFVDAGEFARAGIQRRWLERTLVLFFNVGVANDDICRLSLQPVEHQMDPSSPGGSHRFRSTRSFNV